MGTKYKLSIITNENISSHDMTSPITESFNCGCCEYELIKENGVHIKDFSPINTALYLMPNDKVKARDVYLLETFDTMTSDPTSYLINSNSDYRITRVIDGTVLRHSHNDIYKFESKEAEHFRHRAYYYNIMDNPTSNKPYIRFPAIIGDYVINQSMSPNTYYIHSLSNRSIIEYKDEAVNILKNYISGIVDDNTVPYLPLLSKNQTLIFLEDDVKQAVNLKSLIVKIKLIEKEFHTEKKIMLIKKRP